MASTTTRSPDAAEGLALGDEREDAPTDAQEVLVVELAGAAYALDATQVREVARAAPVTPLPGTARWVLGLAAVRGALLPVGDVRRRASPGAAPGATPAFGEAADARDAWMVVVDDGRRGAALVGWRVRGVASARRDGGADGASASPAAVRDASGLPVRGAVRLSHDARHGTGAGAARLLARRARAAAPASRPDADARADDAVVARLDVAALLDDLYDEGG